MEGDGFNTGGLGGTGMMNNMNQSRESFEDAAFQTKELQIKRQYIDELRKKLNALLDENRYLKTDMGGQGGNEGLE